MTQKLCQANTFRNSLFSDSSAVIVINGSDKDLGVISDCNDAVLHAFGCRRSEIIGSNINSLMPEPFSTHHDFVRSSSRIMMTKTSKPGCSILSRYVINYTIHEAQMVLIEASLWLIASVGPIDCETQPQHRRRDSGFRFRFRHLTRQWIFIGGED